MRALLLALLLATPLQAQHVELDVGPWFAGPMVEEVDRRVRMGNRGQDMAFALRLGGDLSPSWAIDAEVLWVPTVLYIWPATGSGDWTERPFETHLRMSLTWSCATAGPTYRRGWLEAGVGAGICQMSAADYGHMGSAPMHTGGGRIDVRMAGEIAEGFSAGLRCSARPTHLRPQSMTVLRILSGEHAGGPETSWFWSLGCGLSLGVGP